MCGIAGYFSLHQTEAGGSRPDLRSMTRCLAHRGPDDEGHFEMAGAGLGMRRLSVIDLETGHQPMTNEDGTVHLVQNGEIYNYRELRAELLEKGHRFTTESDTEVLVHGYEEWGPELPLRLRGMFAVAILDCRRENRPELLLLRDHCGVKPLYYLRCDDTLVFASEIKSLLATGMVERRIDPRSLDQYLSFLYVPEPRTIYPGVMALPAGHTLACREGSVEISPYWSFEPSPTPFASCSAAKEAVREVFEDSVRAMLVADVPLGLFLSGGVDSASILAMMARHSREPVRTFSIGFGHQERSWDELDTARDLAQRFGADHHEFRVEPDVVGLLPKVVRHFDQPFANPTALILYLLSGETRRHVTVALAGTGGDELFAGYPRYLGMLLHRQVRRVPRALRALAGRASSILPTEEGGGRMLAQRLRRFLEAGELDFPHAYARLLTTVPEQVKRSLYSPDLAENLGEFDATDFVRMNLDHPEHADPTELLLATDIRTYLPYNQLTYGDRMSMARSLEVRVPFVDQRVLEVAARIPLRWQLRRGQTKSLFREAMEPLLPDHVLRGRKRGLNLPIPLWFRGELDSWLSDLLSPDRIRQRNLFRPEAVEALRQEHLSGRRDNSLLLWALATLEVWQQEYMDPPI